MGKKGSGKSFLVKKCLKRIRRYIVLDPLAEYEGVVFHEWHEIALALHNLKTFDFRIVFRPLKKDEIEPFFILANSVNDYTLVCEEVENWCNARYIQQNLEELISFGRHFSRSLVWISRSPFEINRDLTRQSDVLISFIQSEPVDLKYLANYTFDRDIKTLPEYDFAWYGDIQKYTDFVGDCSSR